MASLKESKRRYVYHCGRSHCQLVYDIFSKIFLHMVLELPKSIQLDFHITNTPQVCALILLLTTSQINYGRVGENLCSYEE